MVLQVVQQVQQLAVVGSVTWLAGELVHVGGPAGLADGGDVERVDGLDDAALPLLGRGVDDVRLGVGSDLGLDALLLLEEHAAHLEVAHAGQHGALHYSAAFVVLDVPHPDLLVEGDLLSESLFFEVPDGVVVRVRQEVHHIARRLHVVLEVGHHVCAITLNLLVATNGTENDFGELSALEWAERDPAYNLQWLLYYGKRQVSAVVDEAGDIVLWHFRELFLEDAFQTREKDHGLAFVVIVDDSKFGLPTSFLKHNRLLLRHRVSELRVGEICSRGCLIFTLSGKGIGLIAGSISSSSSSCESDSSSSCFTLFALAGESGSSSALRLTPCE